MSLRLAAVAITGSGSARTTETVSRRSNTSRKRAHCARPFSVSCRSMSTSALFVLPWRTRMMRSNAQRRARLGGRRWPLWFTPRRCVYHKPCTASRTVPESGSCHRSRIKNSPFAILRSLAPLPDCRRAQLTKRCANPLNTSAPPHSSHHPSPVDHSCTRQRPSIPESFLSMDLTQCSATPSRAYRATPNGANAGQRRALGKALGLMPPRRASQDAYLTLSGVIRARRSCPDRRREM